MNCALCGVEVVWNSDLSRWEHADTRLPLKHGAHPEAVEVPAKLLLRHLSRRTAALRRQATSGDLGPF